MKFSNRISKFIAAVLGYSISACATVPVKEYNYATVPNTKVPTLELYGFRRNCEARVPSIRYIEKPTSGTLSVKPKEMVIASGPVSIGSVGDCAGETVMGKLLYYTPAEEFKGIDEFTVDVTFPGLAGVARKKVTVNVR